MHSRQPRLGDILDDYCPRERRVTNHAVVAMIGEEIKQTRCTTCDAEHEYKKAKVPAQRKKKHVATTLYEEVLTGMPGKLAHGVSPQAVSAPADTDEALDVAGPGGLPAPAPVAVAAAPAAGAPGHGNRAGHGDRQGARHRGGKRSK